MSQQIIEAQKYLKDLSLYAGKIDGIRGPKTKSALIRFQQRYFVDGVIDKHTLEALKSAATAWKNRTPIILVDVPTNKKELIESFGKIEYRNVGGGYVKITNNWVEENIDYVNFPIVGKRNVHKKMVSIFLSIFDEIIDKGLEQEIREFGIWCPRHKMHDVNRSLSLHSWGIACDVNQSTNLPGTFGDMSKDLIFVFERHGFAWGGGWSVPDPMHFEYYFRR